MKSSRFIFLLVLLFTSVCSAKFPFDVDAFLFDPYTRETSHRKSLVSRTATRHVTSSLLLADELRGFFNNALYFNQRSDQKIIVEGRFTGHTWKSYQIEKSGLSVLVLRLRFVSLDGRIDFRTKVVFSGSPTLAEKDQFNPGAQRYFVRLGAMNGTVETLNKMIENEFIPHMQQALTGPATRSTDEAIAYAKKAQMIQYAQVQKDKQIYDEWQREAERYRRKNQERFKFLGKLALQVLSGGLNSFGDIASVRNHLSSFGQIGGLPGVGELSSIVKPGKDLRKSVEILKKSYQVVKKIDQSRNSHKNLGGSSVSSQNHHAGNFAGLPGIDSGTSQRSVSDPLRMICVVPGACGDYRFKSISDRNTFAKKCPRVVAHKCQPGPACKHTTSSREVITYTYEHGADKTQVRCASTEGVYLGANYSE